MKRFVTLVLSAAFAAGLVALPACQTDQPGVRSNLRSQYTDVVANTEKATDAAEATLNDLDLKNVEARATAVDGRAVGYTADGTRVTVSVTRIDDNNSQVSVNVGKLGNPSLGTQIVAGIQERLAD